MLSAQAVEEMNDFAAGFPQAHRLGLQPEMELAARLRADAGDMLDAAPQIITNDSLLFRSGDEQFESSGQSTDAAFDVSRKKLGQQIEEQFCIGQALRRGPVRRVNLFF